MYACAFSVLVSASQSGWLKPVGIAIDMAMGQNPNRTPSEHPNPTTKIGSTNGG